MPEKKKIAISMLLTQGTIKSNIAFKIMKAVIIIIKSEFLLGFFKNKSIIDCQASRVIVSLKNCILKKHSTM